LLAGCAGGDAPPDAGTADAGFVNPNLDQAFVDAGPEQRQGFRKGDTEFDTPFYPADGLGPAYANSSCGACHDNGLRGAGFDQRMVMVEADGFTTAADQSPIAFGNEIRALLTAGATTPVVPPDLPNVKVTTRVPPPVLGRGYMEAILDSEIERVEAEQATRTDGIHGQINWVTYASATSADPAFNPYQPGQTHIIGRFGLKARIPTVDDFVADAFQNDMGITSPLRPDELPNPDGVDDLKPGVDTTLARVNEIATYVRLTAIPTRLAPNPRGQALFDSIQCSVCHVPSMKTRPDYPISQLAGVNAPIYSDLLVHDMGEALADGMVDGSATSKQFRTAPLIAERFQRAFLHDGRAHTLDAAIADHAGEAQASAEAYAALSDDDKRALVDFVNSL